MENFSFLMGGHIDGVLIGCSLQVLSPFPAHFCWWSRRGVLRGLLDAFPDCLPSLRPGKNGLPFFSSYGSLEYAHAAHRLVLVLADLTE